MRSLASLSVLATLLIASCQAFAPSQSLSCRSSSILSSPQQNRPCAERPLPSTTTLFLSPEDGSDKESSAEAADPATPVAQLEEESDGILLDVPSPLLLASSIIFAIVATGKSRDSRMSPPVENCFCFAFVAPKICVYYYQ